MEMDLMNDEKRQAKMEPYLQAAEEMNPSEKKVKFHNVDQALDIRKR